MAALDTSVFLSPSQAASNTVDDCRALIVKEAPRVPHEHNLEVLQLATALQNDDFENPASDSQEQAQRRTLMVTHFAREALDEDLKALFNVRIGSTRRVRILRHPSGLSRCCAFVEFHDPLVAYCALEACHRGEIVMDGVGTKRWHLRAYATRKAIDWSAKSAAEKAAELVSQSGRSRKKKGTRVHQHHTPRHPSPTKLHPSQHLPEPLEAPRPLEQLLNLPEASRSLQRLPSLLGAPRGISGTAVKIDLLSLQSSFTRYSF